MRVTAPASAFRGKTGVVVDEIPLDGADEAYGVRLDDAGASVPPMTFYPHEVEVLEPPALALPCARCGLPIRHTADARENADGKHEHAGCGDGRRDG